MPLVPIGEASFSVLASITTFYQDLACTQEHMFFIATVDEGYLRFKVLPYCSLYSKKCSEF